MLALACFAVLCAVAWSVAQGRPMTSGDGLAVAAAAYGLERAGARDFGRGRQPAE
jgi:hypothetical protein